MLLRMPLQSTHVDGPGALQKSSMHTRHALHAQRTLQFRRERLSDCQPEVAEVTLPADAASGRMGSMLMFAFTKTSRLCFVPMNATYKAPLPCATMYLLGHHPVRDVTAHEGHPCLIPSSALFKQGCDLCSTSDRDHCSVRGVLSRSDMVL